MGKYWNMASVSDTDGEITLYGDVLDRTPTDWWTGEPESGLFITPEGFLEDLEAVKDKQNITVKINSCGGDLYTGIAIHNALKGLQKNITVLIEGIAASAASIIACAGDTVKVYPGSLLMIHGVSGFFGDFMNLQELKKAAKSFDVMENAIAEIYKEKTGISVESLRSMMAQEKWMTGKDAVEKHFADELIEDMPAMEMKLSGDVLIVNGIRHNVSGLSLPDGLPIKKTAEKLKMKNSAPAEKGREKPMTLEELKNQYPELMSQYETDLKNSLTAQITASAVEAERTRLQEIESIEASVQDKELIHEAKFGEKPMNAAQLALKAMQKQAALGAQHLKNWEADLNHSGTQGVQATGQGTEKTPEEEAKEAVDRALKLFNQTKGGC